MEERSEDELRARLNVVLDSVDLLLKEIGVRLVKISHLRTEAASLSQELSQQIAKKIP